MAGIEPRLLARDDAAKYCGVSPYVLERHCPVKPVRLGRLKRWDRAALDRWLDSQGQPQPSSAWLERLRHVPKIASR